MSVQYRQLWAPAVGLSGSFSCCFLVLAFGIAKALCIPPTLQCLVIRHMAASMVETETAEMVTVVTETQTAGTTTTTTAEGKAAVEKVHVMGATGTTAANTETAAGMGGQGPAVKAHPPSHQLRQGQPSHLQQQREGLCWAAASCPALC